MKAVLEDWRTAPVDARTRVTLAFLEKLTQQPEAVTAEDIKPMLAEGLTKTAIEDAIHVCTLFSVYDRLADSFEFHIPDARGFEMSATMLLKRGYV